MENKQFRLNTSAIFIYANFPAVLTIVLMIAEQVQYVMQ